MDENRLVPERKKFYSQFVGYNDLCFDVGANIGNRTEIFLDLGAKVVAIEPQPECAQILKFRFGRKIELLELALGREEGSGVIYISETSEISSLSTDWIDSVSKSRFRDKSWNSQKTVEITTLDKLISKYGVPKFCKIDVEGFEEEVLRGLTLPIPYISFEYTVPERLANLSNCLVILSNIGRFEFNFTIGENTQLELTKWETGTSVLERITNTSIKEIFGDIYVRSSRISDK